MAYRTLQREGKKTKLAAQVTEDIPERVRRAAAMAGVLLSDWIQDAIEAYLEQQEVAKNSTQKRKNPRKKQE